MDIKPIKNETDYDAALERIDVLMGAERDTPEGDELSTLVTLVEEFEDAMGSLAGLIGNTVTHFTNWPSSVGLNTGGSGGSRHTCRIKKDRDIQEEKRKVFTG